MHPITDYIPTVIFVAAAIAIPSDQGKVESIQVPEPEAIPVLHVEENLEVQLWGPADQSSELFNAGSFARAADDPEYAYAFEEAYRRWLETGLEPAQ